MGIYNHNYLAEKGLIPDL